MRSPLLILLIACAGCGIFEDPDDIALDRDMATSVTDVRTPNDSSSDGGNTNSPDEGTVDVDTADMGTAADVRPGDAGTMADGGFSDDVGTEPDQGMTPAGSGCSGPSLADTSSPDVIVGSGTADSCDETALQAAVDAGGVVTFSCGAAAHAITVTSPIKLATDVVIDGDDLITLSGGGASRIVEVDVLGPAPRPVVQLQRIRLSNGFVPSTDTNCGAAIRRTGGKLFVVDVDFNSNRCEAMAGGGAIRSSGTEITEVAGSTFTGNTAHDGGAIAGSAIVSDSTFTSNTATKWGGAIATVGGRIEVCGSTFRGNITADLGGGVFFTATSADDPTVIVDRSSFYANEAKQGGGVYTYGAHSEVLRSLFDGNVANTSSGARLQNGTVLVENSTFVNNEASGLGGGLALLTVTGTVRNITVVGNDTGSFAAGVAGGENVVLSNSVFDNNYGANVFEDQSCNAVMIDGGGNVQWPEERPSGQTDGKCADGVLLQDPLFEPYDTMLGVVPPMSGSPILGYGSDCPAQDQLGHPRPADGCTSGAYEAP